MPPISFGAGGFGNPKKDFTGYGGWGVGSSFGNGTPQPTSSPSGAGIPAAPTAPAMPASLAGGGPFPGPPDAGGGVIKGAAPQPGEDGGPSSLRGLAQAMQPENALSSARSSLREGLGMRMPPSLDALFADVRKVY